GGRKNRAGDLARERRTGRPPGPLDQRPGPGHGIGLTGNHPPTPRTDAPIAPFHASTDQTPTRRSARRRPLDPPPSAEIKDPLKPFLRTSVVGTTARSRAQTRSASSRVRVTSPDNDPMPNDQCQNDPVPNGRPGDNPITDVSTHGLTIYGH